MKLTPPERAQIADAVEAAAFVDMYDALPAELGASLTLRAIRRNGMTLLMAHGVPDPVFSRVIGFGNDGRVDAGALDEVVRKYASAEAHAYWIHVNPVLTHPELVTLLESRGLTLAQRRSWAKMLRDSAPAQKIETPLVVRPAHTDELASASAVVAKAFGMPSSMSLWIETMARRSKWTMLAAYQAEKIVGGGMVFIDGDHAWLGLGGVLEEARGKHAHQALMAARIQRAIDCGCTHIVTETGEPIGDEPNPSLHNMYRLGFEHVASRLNYAAPSRSK